MALKRLKELSCFSQWPSYADRSGANPVLAWMAQNLFIQMDKNENMMPTKAKSTGRIDGIVATIMALGLANTPAEPDMGACYPMQFCDGAAWRECRLLSALPLKAGVGSQAIDVRLVPEADEL